jgi:hypothetical protein
MADSGETDAECRGLPVQAEAAIAKLRWQHFDGIDDALRHTIELGYVILKRPKKAESVK